LSCANWARSKSHALLGAEDFDGVKAHGAAGGKITGQECHGHQEERHSEKGGGVGSADAVEQAGHKAREGQSAGDAQRDSSEDELHSLANEEAEDIARVSAESETYTDLAGAPADAE